jgi:phosphate transport system substrate-binding protein
MKLMKLTMMIAMLALVMSAAVFSQVQLNGAGSTFDYPIFSKWFDFYKTKTGVQINYQSIGSGGGIKGILDGTLDFGASDGPMTDEQLKEAKEKQHTLILHLPIIMGGVAITYNLPSVGNGLKLTGDVLAKIYFGQITNWNDPAIKALNPDKTFPDLAILVTHRSDGSGTTYCFVDYLCKVDKEWADKIGRGTSVNWPVGLGGKGSEGVTGLIRQSEGAIGYVELAYAVQNKLPYAQMKNKSGNFVFPTLENVSEAAAGAIKTMPADLRVSITDAPGKNVYPISTFSWILAYQHGKDKTKTAAFKKFLMWAVTDGQKYAKDLLYAPIPPQVTKLNEKKIHSIE